MHLPIHVLGKHLEQMPLDEEHTMVWHLCRRDIHLSQCYEVGKLAVVSFEVPPIENIYEKGMFLVRLHPKVGILKELDDGSYGVRMPEATSFPHSVVWGFPQTS